MEDGFEVLDHTADTRLLIRGRNFSRLLEQAGRGLFEVLLNPRCVAPKIQKNLEAEGESRQALLRAWLSELLWLFENERFAVSEFSVEAGELAARGILRGEPFDPARHEPRVEVKGITLHQLRVSEIAGGLEAEVVLDI